MLPTAALTFARLKPSPAGLIAQLKAVPGLVRLWALQEAEGATTAVDQTGTASGTMTATVSGRRGLVGKACNFNGTSSTIQTALNAEAAANIGAATIVALVRPTAVNGCVYMEENTVGAFAGGRFSLVVTAAPAKCRVASAATGTDSQNTVTHATILSLGRWVLLGGGVDVANDLNFAYVNGVQGTPFAATNVATAWEATFAAVPPTIGENIDTSAAFLSGDVEFVAIYNRLWTPGEHARLAATLGRYLY